MKSFLETLDLEIKREQKKLEDTIQFLQAAPKGFLNIKKRARSESYYQEIDDYRGGQRYRKQINITQDKELVQLLTKKKIMSIRKVQCEKNLRYLEKLKKNYKDTDISAVAQGLCPSYQQILQQREEALREKQQTASYSKAPFDPRYHTHETDCGTLVRSKSEQILANALYAYQIVFYYEKELLYEEGEGGRIYPDFTIPLPNGKVIIWEHLGLLSNESYCWHNAKKLNIYQRNGFTIGENLILTMDDSKQNFSSALIHKIIREQILPNFLEKESDFQL